MIFPLVSVNFKKGLPADHCLKALLIAVLSCAQEGLGLSMK